MDVNATSLLFSFEQEIFFKTKCGGISGKPPEQPSTTIVGKMYFYITGSFSLVHLDHWWYKLEVKGGELTIIVVARN